jgi:c-di-GMP-related signal transduction protein
MKEALMGKPNRMYTWLDMAESLERAEWEKAYKLLQDLKIDEKRAAELYSKAYSWSEGMLSFSLER